MDEETNPQRGYVICLRLQDKSKVDPSVRLPLHHANMSWGMVKIFESVSLDSMLQTIEKERDKRKKRKRDKEKEEGGNASTCCGVSVSLPNSCVCVCVCEWVLSRVWLFATPWTVAHQAPVHGSLQARIPEWVAVSSSGVSSWPRDQTHVSLSLLHCRQILYHWATREAQIHILKS